MLVRREAGALSDPASCRVRVPGRVQRPPQVVLAQTRENNLRHGEPRKLGALDISTRPLSSDHHLVPRIRVQDNENLGPLWSRPE